MRLTLLRAKEALASHAPADLLEDRINRALERIFVSGKFNGSMDRIALQSVYGDITLPRQYRTVEGVKIDRDGNGTYRVRTLTNGWYEFLEGKQSMADASRQGYGLGTVRSLGDGHAIMHDLPLAGILTTSGATDEIITVYGRDVDGMPLTLVFTGSESHPNTFIKIERVHKEQTPDVAITLKHTSDAAVDTTLAVIEPLEEETYYRRYRDDAITNVPEANALALAKWRHIETTSDNDVLRITNITALGMEMDSLQYLAENDHTVAAQYHDLAINLLNEELRDSHSVDEVPTLRFHYPGQTTPHLTSHY